MYILEYKDGVKPDKLSPKAKANMERCANFLVEMIDKYGKCPACGNPIYEGKKNWNFQNGREVKKQTDKKLPATCGESCLY